MSEFVSHPLPEEAPAPLAGTDRALSSQVVEDRSTQLMIVVSVCFASFMARLDTFIVNISLPGMARYFHASTSEITWVVLSFLLLMMSSLLVLGRLTDRLGSRTTFMAGYLIFTAGSLLCGLSGSLAQIVAARALQGVGCAMLQVTAYTTISSYLPSARRGWAFGMVTTTAALGVTLGAPLGGWITTTLSWRWIFLINVPVGLVAFTVAARVLPRIALPQARQQPFDILGAVLSFPAVLGLVYGLNAGQELGWDSPAILAIFLGSAFFFGLFIQRERRAEAPLLNLSLFGVRAFSFALAACCLAFLVLSGTNVLMPFYLEGFKGLDAQHAGLVLLVYSGVFVTVGPFAGRLSDRFPPAVLCSLAMALAALNDTVFALTLGRPGFTPVVVFLAIFGLSSGLFISPNNNLLMTLAPSSERGTVAAVMSCVSNFGSLMGAVIFESLYTHVLPVDAKVHTMTSLPQHMEQGFGMAFVFAAATCGLAFLISLKQHGRKGTADPRRQEVALAVEVVD